MRDYYKQLSFYMDEESRDQTESYFEKYWLSKSEYLQKWLLIQKSIYDVSGFQFPYVKFQTDFEIIALRGGLIFTEQDFTLLKDCLKETGESHFVIVENVDEDNPHHGEPPLRFKYPLNISWQELLSGGYISQELFQMSVKE